MSAGRGLRPAHNRNCSRIGADGLSLRPIAWPHVAKRHWLRQQHDNMIGPRILGASAHIVSGSFREPDAPGTNQCWPWLTLLTHLPKSSSHAVTNHNRSTAPASIRAPRRAHPSLSARLSLLLEPDRS